VKFTSTFELQEIAFNFQQTGVWSIKHFLSNVLLLLSLHQSVNVVDNLGTTDIPAYKSVEILVFKCTLFSKFKNHDLSQLGSLLLQE